MELDRNAETEKSIEKIAASFSFENMILTDEDKDNMRKVLNREQSADKIINDIEMKYGLKKNGH